MHIIESAKTSNNPHGRSLNRLGMLAGIAAAGLITTHAATAAAPPGNGWVMAWNDEFNGSSVNTSNWTIGTGNRRGAVNTANALTVANGYLRIQTYTEGGTHYTGWIGSHGKFEDCFGYWEARIRFNSSAGMWSAFWLQPHGINNVGNPAAHGTEIDIVEHRSRDSGGADLRNRAAINVHWDGYGSQQKTVGTVVNNPGANPASLQGNWHTYGLLWEPGRYRFYIDGVEVWSTTAAISQVRQWIYLTSEVQNNAWAGPIPSGGYGSRSTSNTYMDVDYVRFYQRAEQTTNSHFGHRMGPWRQQGGTSWSATGGRGGGGAGYLNPTSSGGSRIAQTVAALLPNTPYVARGWGRIDHDDPGWSAPVRIGARNFGGPEQWAPISTRAFSAAEVPFTTGPSHSSASVFGHAPTTWTKSFIDDITVSRAGRFTNGGFELGDDAHWHTYGDAFVHAWSAAFRRSGLQAARLNTSNNARGFEQTIRGLKPATGYTISMWHKGNSQPVRLGVKNHGGDESFTSSTASGGNWRRATHAFTTGESATSATVFAMIPSGSNVAAVDIDDFLIAEGTVGGWTGTDIGTGALPGESAMSDGNLIVRGSGNNLGGSAGDVVRFLHQPFDGVGHITARLNSFEARHDRAKAGVMIRAATADNAPFAMVHWLPEGRVEFLHRPGTGAPSAHVWSSATVPWPPHLRLNRPVPGMVAAQFSTDGTNWIDVGTPQPVDLPDEALAGPAVTSHDTASTGEAVFGSIELFAVPADLDTDGDGLTDIEEELLGTDPLTPNDEIVWWPGGTPGGAGSWLDATAWRLGAATTGWTPGRTALFAVTPGMVTIDGPVTGIDGLTFHVASYHLAGAGPLAFGAADDAEIRLPDEGTTTISTPFAGTGALAAIGGGRLDLRGDNRGFTGALALHDGAQLRPYHSGTGSATGHETGGAEASIDIGDGSQIRWFNLANDAGYPGAFAIAGPSSPLGNPGALNLDTAQARTVTLSGPVTTLAPATIGTQNNGSFLLSGPVTGAHPLAIHLGNAATTLAGAVDLPSITRSGGGTLVFAESVSLELPVLVHQGGGYQFDAGTTAGIGTIELAGALTLNVADMLEVPSQLTGTGSLVKTGGGTLVLAGPNAFGTGNLTHGSATTNRGFLRLTHDQALGSHTSITLAGGQGGISGIELAGDVAISQNLLTAGRHNATETGYILRNLHGENTWAGGITITAGGGTYGILSDAGHLDLTGVISSAVESNQFGARLLQFAGAGDITISGTLARAGEFTMQDLTVTKSGTGTLTIAGNADFTGPTTAQEGTLRVDGAIAASHVTVEQTATLAGTGSLPSATVRGTLALETHASLAITGTLALNDATLAIHGSPGASEPVILATHGGLTGEFAEITGVPEGWALDTAHAGGTAIALVPDAPAGFAAWSATHLGGQGPDDDFHNDGIANLLRYALAIDPAQPSGFPGNFANGTLTYEKRPEAVAAGDVTYTILASPDLSPGSWTPIAADIDNDSVISITPPVDGSRLFLRLAVEWSE